MIARVTYDDNTNELLDDLAWEYDCTHRDIIVALCIFTSIAILENPNLISMFENCVDKAKEAYKRGYRVEGEDENE